jgi:ABC-type multidrug transport system fused ATPase/permease subunit
LYAVGFFLLQESASLLSNRFFQLAQTQSVLVRGAFYGVIYRKSTRLSLKSRQNFNAGKVVNLISTDVNRIETFLLTANSTWTAPIQILVLSILLCVVLGPAALVGIGILLGLGPLQGRLFGYLGKLRKDQAPITDDRVKQTQEIIEGIRVIKFFAWELPYLKTLEELRGRELGLILKRK